MTSQTKKPENQKPVFTPLRISEGGPGPDNGPAFPSEEARHWGHRGLTLWDYHAAHAPKNFQETHYFQARQIESAAELAGLYSDAMLAERAKRGIK